MNLEIKNNIYCIDARFIISIIAAIFFGFTIANMPLLSLALFGAALVVFLSIKLPLIFLFVVFLIHERGFETINYGIDHWVYPDIALVILMTGVVSQLLAGKFNLKEVSENSYLKFIIAILLLVHVSIFFGGYFVLNQPVDSLIFRPRAFYFYLVFLFLLMSDFKFKDIKIFMQIVLLSAIGISVLLIVDAKVLGGGKIFNLAMLNGISGTRLGSARIATYVFMTVWMYFYLLARLKHCKKPLLKFLYLTSLALILYQIVFVAMIRQLFIMMLLATGIFLLNLKMKRKIIVISIFIIFLCLVIYYFANNDFLFRESYFYKLTEHTLTEIQKTSEGNFAIRLNAARFFYPYFQKTFFLGMGILSPTYKNSPVCIGLQCGYNFADLGIISVIYRFGILAILTIVLLLKKAFHDLKFIIKTSDGEARTIAESIFYFLICLIVLILPTTIFFNGGDVFYYAIVLYFIYRMKKDLKHAL